MIRRPSRRQPSSGPRRETERHRAAGEQQRLAIARAILDKPDWLFLDEATSALDEQLEAEIYGMLGEVLPNKTIVSIGHRSTLIELHRRYIEMTPGPDSVFEPLPRIGWEARQALGHEPNIALQRDRSP